MERSTLLLQNSVATSTKRQYHSCLKKYVSWCRNLDLLPFPLQQPNMILFASELASSTSYKNIKVHLAAIKFYAQVHGYCASFLSFNRLYLLLRGIKRMQGDKYNIKKRSPITPHMLEEIKFNLFNSSKIYEDKLMLWSAMLTAFFGFLRVSEYTSTFVKSYDPCTTLCYEDVVFKDKQIDINVKASKTDPFQAGSVIRLASNYSGLCPFRAIHGGTSFQFRSFIRISMWQIFNEERHFKLFTTAFAK